MPSPRPGAARGLSTASAHAGERIERRAKPVGSARWAVPSAATRTLAGVSATTDVILAAGPTVVALAAIGSAVWQQKRGFSHDREMDDLSDTRRLFDDAAVALHDASVAL